MLRLFSAATVFDDIDRVLEQMARFGVEDPRMRIGELMQAIQTLTHSPLIGRPVRGGRRELVIGRSSHGYVALYRYVAGIDAVFVLAIRSQRELGYKSER
jgi:plasmid stabilization system protein ParE